MQESLNALCGLEIGADAGDPLRDPLKMCEQIHKEQSTLEKTKTASYGRAYTVWF